MKSPKILLYHIPVFIVGLCFSNCDRNTDDFEIPKECAIVPTTAFVGDSIELIDCSKNAVTHYWIVSNAHENPNGNPHYPTYSSTFSTENAGYRFLSTGEYHIVHEVRNDQGFQTNTYHLQVRSMNAKRISFTGVEGFSVKNMTGFGIRFYFQNNTYGIGSRDTKGETSFRFGGVSHASRCGSRVGDGPSYFFCYCGNEPVFTVDASIFNSNDSTYAFVGKNMTTDTKFKLRDELIYKQVRFTDGDKALIFDIEF